MAVTATSPIALAIDRLRDLIAASSTWRTWGGWATAALAKAAVYAFDTPSASLPTLPFAVVGLENFSWAKLGAPITWDQGGNLTLTIVAAVPEAYQASGSETDAVLDFMNKVGAVVSEMTALAGLDGALDMVRVEPADEPMRADEAVRQTEGDFFEWVLRVTVGSGGVV